MTATKTQHPRTSKALVFDHISHTLEINPCHPLPTPDFTKGDHLVHPSKYPDYIFAENPEKEIIPCYDVAGLVIDAPPHSPFQAGDEIYARTLPSRPGNCREYTIVRTNEMALKPKLLSWLEAASVPLSAVTAWQALFEHAGIEGLRDCNAAKNRVLVTAAAGGVGVWLVLLARSAGLEVVAQVGSERNEELVRKLGATSIVNYRVESLKRWSEREGQVDIVFDLVGGKSVDDQWYCVKDQGMLISMVEPPEDRRPADLKGKDVNNLFFIMKPDGEQLAEISNLLESGQSQAVVDSVWDFEDYEGAFARLNSGHATGKVVIKVTG
ncbi:hypothetical protein ACLMJK_001414 [Lecanora helva]